jgi:hypothetical protein
VWLVSQCEKLKIRSKIHYEAIETILAEDMICECDNTSDVNSSYESQLKARFNGERMRNNMV